MSYYSSNLNINLLTTMTKYYKEIVLHIKQNPVPPNTGFVADSNKILPFYRIVITAARPHF
ncbi:hypothetical protein JCM14036_10730 [Desulfotomaculum defluvii]